MKKVVTLIAIINILILFTGCNFPVNKIPEDLKEVKLNQQFLIISEDEKKYIAKIQFENSTNYNFIPTGVYVQPEIRYMENGVDTIKPNPIQLQSEQVGVNQKKYEYKVEIPKKIFEVYEHTDKENIVVLIQGIFTKNDRIVLELSQAEPGRLVKR